MPELVANPALAEQELHFKAKYELEEMCRDQWNWQSCVQCFVLSLLNFYTDYDLLCGTCRKNPQGYEGATA